MTERQTSSKFNELFENKCNLCSISEKAFRNLQLKVSRFSKDNAKKNYICDNTKLQPSAVHYFAIGHTFKNFDVNDVFEMKVDGNSLNKTATKFRHLLDTKDNRENGFFDIDRIFKLIQDIRHINSHYIHDFENIAIDDSDNLFIFLKESFELASLNVSGIIGKEDQNKKLANFLYDKFHLSIKKNSTKDECIEDILFIDNTKEDKKTEWTLKNGKKAFDINPNKYLSFYACLFLLSMFLYKDESNLLISRIKGFKRNGTEKEQAKRNVFTFYSKKLSSQDIDSEESDLVKFRDIIQYLNKYPYAWTKAYNDKEISREFKDKFIKNILKFEIERALLNNDKNRFYFIKDEEKEAFYLYTMYQVWGLDKSKFKKMSFTLSQIDNFNNVITHSLKIQGILKEQKELIKKYGKFDKKVKDLETKLKTAIKTDKVNAEKEIKARGKEIGMPASFEIEKIKTRFYNGKLFNSYGRNTDKFMKYATRFLAENKFFGEEAKFKCYKWFTSDEQNVDIIKLKGSLSKKEFDSLKYHQGRLIEYIKYSDFLEKKEHNYIPFVIQNNAIQVKITIDGFERILSIQRKLMVNLLHYALSDYSSQKKSSDPLSNRSINNLGLDLITSYYKEYKNDFNNGIEYLKQIEEIDTNKFSNLNKLFPKRLLHNYSSNYEYKAPEISVNKQFLEKTKEQNKKYNELYEEAKNKDILEDFLKKNKGKKYKLDFIKKAWNQMYFKEIYLEQTNIAKSHHKGFNITKEEYNDFCKAMYSFNGYDDVYKKFLTDLFKSKKFLDNQEFKTLFNDSECLEDLYIKTIKAYEKWLDNSSHIKNTEEKFKLNCYKFINEPNKHILYINISHFLSFLKKQNKINVKNNQIRYILLYQHKSVLIQEYYLDYKFINKNDKASLRLFNKLNDIRFEDVLLYEIAIWYFELDKTTVKNLKNIDVRKIYNSDITYKFNKISVVVPFKKLLDFELWLNRDYEKSKSKKNNGTYITKISTYLDILEKEIKTSYTNCHESKRVDLNDLTEVMNSYSENKTLSLDSFYKFNTHLVNNARKFSRIWLVLEEYYIKKYDKDLNIIFKDHRIEYEELEFLKNYKRKSSKNMRDMRNAAFHINIPMNYSFHLAIKMIGKRFIQEEIKTLPKSVSVLSKDIQSVCGEFINILYPIKYSKSDSDCKWKSYDRIIKYYLTEA